MQIFLWILFGALVGFVASLLMHTKRRGIIKNIIIGLLGAFLGGFIASFFGFGSLETFTIESFLIALGGAVLLLFILRKLKI